MSSPMNVKKVTVLLEFEDDTKTASFELNASDKQALVCSVSVKRGIARNEEGLMEPNGEMGLELNAYLGRRQ